MAARLVRMGHSSDDIMRYTPRQAAAWLYFGEVDRCREVADQLSIGLNSSRGDPKDVSQTIEDLRE